jgi:hypothetical protein
MPMRFPPSRGFEREHLPSLGETTANQQTFEESKFRPYERHTNVTGPTRPDGKMHAGRPHLRTGEISQWQTLAIGEGACATGGAKAHDH